MVHHDRRATARCIIGFLERKERALNYLILTYNRVITKKKLSQQAATRENTCELDLTSSC